jgi:Transposase IS4
VHTWSEAGCPVGLYEVWLVSVWCVVGMSGGTSTSYNYVYIIFNAAVSEEKNYVSQNCCTQFLAFVFFYRYFSVVGVLSMLEDEEFQSADIFILPPEDATKSDEDSGPDDDDGDINNLSGNQLRAEGEATVKVSTCERKQIGGMDISVYADEDVTFDSETSTAVETTDKTAKRGRRSAANAQPTVPAPSTSRRQRSSPPDRQWVKCDTEVSDIPWCVNEPEINSMDWTPSSLFELFFDDTVIDHITRMTNLYAMQNSKQLGASMTEIRLVIAILLISGYIPLVNR